MYVSFSSAVQYLNLALTSFDNRDGVSSTLNGGCILDRTLVKETWRGRPGFRRKSPQFAALPGVVLSARLVNTGIQMLRPFERRHSKRPPLSPFSASCCTHVCICIHCLHKLFRPFPAGPSCISSPESIETSEGRHEMELFARHILQNEISPLSKLH